MLEIISYKFYDLENHNNKGLLYLTWLKYLERYIFLTLSF